ncbi:hypothetical protein FB451DRAFT_542979 [Mycena latifolia]|nr:hypothetical protein FB451DRAFT_542979 [Mycena latifolia]
MALLESVFLRVLHSFYFLIALLSACWHRFHSTPPLPLQVTRRRTPQHLALLVLDSPHDSAVIRDSLLESVSRTVGWCRAVGIPKLTLFDSEGVLVDCRDQIYQLASIACELPGYESSSESDIDYPPTPPSSDCSDSRPLSPEDLLQKDNSVVTFRFPEVVRKRTSRYGLKRRHQDREKSDPSKPPLTLFIASRQSSKPAIAAAATSLARRQARTMGTDLQQFNLSVEMLNSILEGKPRTSDASPAVLTVSQVHIPFLRQTF